MKQKINYIVVILLFQFIHTSIMAQQRALTKAEFIEDINYLYEKIKTIHPNYQQITPEKLWVEKKIEIINSIKEPISILDCNYKMLEFVGLLRDAHTDFDIGRLRRFDEVITPNDIVLPITLFFVKKKVFVKYNFSTVTLPKKCEILEINNIPSDSLIKIISKFVIHENNLEYLLNTHQEMSERNCELIDVLNYLKIKSPYKLKIRDNKTQMIDSIIISGIKSKELNFKTDSIKKKEEPIELIEINKNTALLNINTFWKSYYYLIGNTSYYGRYSERKANRIFNKARNYQNLIIDVRKNGGGQPKLTYAVFDNLIYGNYKIHKEIIDNTMFSMYSNRKIRAFYKDYYHLKKPSILKRKIDYLYLSAGKNKEKITNTDSLFNDIERRNRRKGNYTGNVYVLMGNGSYSATVAFLDLIKYNSIGLTIGESSGAYRAVSYYEIRNYLPKSGNSFDIRSTYKLPLIGGNLSEPIPPDLYKPTTVEDFLNETDSQLDYVLELIKQGVTIKNYKTKLNIK